jgi:hypothetical protein
MRPPRPTLCLLVAATIVRAGTAAAQSPPDADAEARQRFGHGQDLYALGQYRDALAEFTAAYELSHRPLLLFNMAECERLDGDLDRARADYQRYLTAEPNGAMASIAKDRLAKLPAPPPPPAAPPPPPAPPPPAPTTIDLDPHHVIRDTPERQPPLASLVVEPAPPTPFYQRWPFWAAVGGGVVLTSLIVIAASQHGGPSCSGCEVVDLR